MVENKVAADFGGPATIFLITLNSVLHPFGTSLRLRRTYEIFFSNAPKTLCFTRAFLMAGTAEFSTILKNNDTLIK